MHRTSFAEMRCSLARGLELIGDWWSPLILRDLFLGLTRFDELVEDLGISRNLLTDRLKHLVAQGVVVRTPYATKPQRHEYHLSEKGRDLVPVILALTAWGDRWAGPQEGSPILFRHRSCGNQFEPRIVCSVCGEPVLAQDVIALPGPGGAAAPGTRLAALKLRYAAVATAEGRDSNAT